MDYWKECISEAFEDAGIKATKEQIDTVASWVEGAHDNHSMSHGYDVISNPLEDENKELKRKLYIERDKRVCKECRGSGELVTYGPCHSASSSCYKCNGEGKV